MTDARIFRLAHAEARRRAKAAVDQAPDLWLVRVEPPKRSLDQNAMLWPLLECFARQLEWPVNGKMVHLTADEWKTILSASFKRESARMSPSVDGGGFVLLGLRTSQMSKGEFSEFLEFVMATAADRGVNIEEHEHV